MKRSAALAALSRDHHHALEARLPEPDLARLGEAIERAEAGEP